MINLSSASNSDSSEVRKSTPLAESDFKYNKRRITNAAVGGVVGAATGFAGVPSNKSDNKTIVVNNPKDNVRSINSKAVGAVTGGIIGAVSGYFGTSRRKK